MIKCLTNYSDLPAFSMDKSPGSIVGKPEVGILPWHIDEIRVYQALDRSIIDFASLCRASVIAYGYPQSQEVLLIELS
jgi:hypothetical protein